MTSLHMPRAPQFCPHAPHPRQALFLSLTCREALYGGAAGGGKSDALLMAALQYVDVPGYAALILRKSYADLALPDAIMDRAKNWLTPLPTVHWNDQRKVFTFPSGATLTFGYLKYERDKFRYQGSAYQFIGFDELTQFREDEYLYLLSRIRKPEAGPLAAVPLRIRGASNPGGIGHDWVKARFIPQVDEQVGEIVFPSDEAGDRRVFIPAKLRDNPSLNVAVYTRNLQALDPILRAQLLEGDWGARPPGEMFDRNWFRIVVSDEERAYLRSNAKQWVRYWDLAGTEKRGSESREAKKNDPDWTVGTLMGRTHDDLLVIPDIRRIQGRPDTVEKLIKDTAQQDVKVWGNRRIRMEQEPGSAGKFVIERFAKLLIGYDFGGVKTTGPKEERARPYAAYAANGLVRVFAAPWNSDWLSEHEAFPNEGLHDDQVDSASGGFADLVDGYYTGSGTVAPPAKATQGSYVAPRRPVTIYGAPRRTIVSRR